MDSYRQQTRQVLVPAASSDSGSVIFPGELSFSGLDMQTGYITCPALLRLMWHGRLLVFYLQPAPYTFIDYPKLALNHVVFVLSGRLTIPASFYQTSMPKHPATVHTKLVTFRRSSLVVETSLALSNQVDRARVFTNLVLVASETRKPESLPGWWREKYRKFSSTEAVSFVRAFDPPNQLFCRGIESKPYTLTVSRRDMNEGDHVGVAGHLQYCIDALEHHLYTNHVHCDINTVSLLVKTALFTHRGEAIVGDILTVALWDGQRDPDTVAFDISKLGKSIYQAKLQFHDARSLQTHSNL